MDKRLKQIIARKLFEKATSFLYFVGTKRFYKEPVKAVEPEAPFMVTRIRLTNNHHTAVDNAIWRSAELVALVQKNTLDDRAVSAAVMRHDEFVKTCAVVRGHLGDKQAPYSWELAFVGDNINTTELIEIRRYTKGFGHQLSEIVVHAIPKA